MKGRFTILEAVCVVIAVLLVKLAFFGDGRGNQGLIPTAHADGSILEWHGSKRIVTSGEDGAATYVWDYDAKTVVRKYFIKDGTLRMQSFKIGKK